MLSKSIFSDIQTSNIQSFRVWLLVIVMTSNVQVCLFMDVCIQILQMGTLSSGKRLVSVPTSGRPRAAGVAVDEKDTFNSHYLLALSHS